MIIIEKPAECGLFFIHLNHSVFIISPLTLFIEAFLGSQSPQGCYVQLAKAAVIIYQGTSVTRRATTTTAMPM